VVCSVASRSLSGLRQMLPARDRDIIQKWFIEHESLRREVKRKDALRVNSALCMFVLGGLLASALLNPDGQALKVLWGVSVSAFVVAVVAYFELRRSIRETGDRLHEIEERFRKFGLSVTANGRMETPTGQCDPLYTEAYDPGLPPLERTKMS